MEEFKISNLPTTEVIELINKNQFQVCVTSIKGTAYLQLFIFKNPDLQNPQTFIVDGHAWTKEIYTTLSTKGINIKRDLIKVSLEYH